MNKITLLFAAMILGLTVEAQTLKGQDVSIVNTTQYTPCAGDFNNDGYITVTDMGWLLGSFGCTNSEEDLDGDGLVGVSDILQFVSLWGSEC